MSPFVTWRRFYEILEDTVTEAILDNTDDAYKEPLEPSVSVEEVGSLVTLAGGPRAFESAWRRFIIRYLRHPNPVPADLTFEDYIGLVRFRSGLEVDEHQDLVELCSRMRVGQAMAVLQHVRAVIGAEKREAARQRQREAEGPAVGGQPEGAQVGAYRFRSLGGGTAGGAARGNRRRARDAAV
jgi:hypothetical protein